MHTQALIFYFISLHLICFELFISLLFNTFERHILNHVLYPLQLVRIETFAGPRCEHTEIQIVHVLNIAHLKLHRILDVKFYLQLNLLLHAHAIAISREQSGASEARWLFLRL